MSTEAKSSPPRGATAILALAAPPQTFAIGAGAAVAAVAAVAAATAAVAAEPAGPRA
jgi:hypothetical protein